MWSPDGRELFYRSPDAIMAVSVKTDPTLTLDTPKSLFPNNYIGQFDIHPDGQRFLMMKHVASSDDQTALERLCKINIVLNWFEELKGQVPVGSD